MDDVITIGNNFKPPVVCMETSQKVYKHVESDDFDIAKFNGLLMAVVVYLDKHDVDYGDKSLPWAENFTEN